jgi:hypothetical protein
MALPAQAITLSTAQIEELSRHFSSFRHDVNGCLSLVVAATELIRYNPAVVQRMAGTLVEQPPRIAGKVSEFVEECERAIGLRNPEPSWYHGLWKRTNVGASGPTQPVTVEAAEARGVHGELAQLGKELTQLGFMISGARALAARDGSSGTEALPTVADQFSKTVAKFEQAAARCETVLKIEETSSRRLATGMPSGAVTLAPEAIEKFQRRIEDMQRDVHEQLKPLLELSRIARNTPDQLQNRAGEFVQQPPRISAIMTDFGNDFDQVFGIVRATA